MKKIYPSSAPDFVAIIGFLLILIISVWISTFWLPNIYIIIGTIALNIIIIANYFLMKPIVIIEDDKVIIRNALKSYVFSIPEMEKIQKHHSAVAIRSFGIGGVLGYFGLYNGDELWLVTHKKKCLRFQQGKQIVVASPDAPEEVLKEIKGMKE